MADLKYKTRSMVEPRHMFRVYFCCHPADFHSYFEKISDEILTKENCSIWYFAPGEEILEEDLEQLSSMGDLCKKERQWDAARDYYQKAIDLYTTLAAETDWIEVRRNLMWSYNSLGDVCLLAGNWQEGKKYYQKSNKLCADVRKNRAR